jgi:HD-like signal output (HDOD) protein
MDEKSAELILMGFEHNEVSAKLVEAWALPALISEAIRYHDHPGLVKDEYRSLANILRLSKYIATALNDKDKSPRDLSIKVGEYLRILGKDMEEKALLEEIKELYIKTLGMEDQVFMKS